MLLIYIFAIILCFSLAVAEKEIFQTFSLSPRVGYTSLPSVLSQSNILLSSFPNNGLITESSPSLNGFVSSERSSTQHPIEGSAYIQPATLQGFLQEQPHISAATNQDVSGALALSSNGYASSAGSSTQQHIEGSTYQEPAALQGYLHQPVISAAPNPAIELFVMSLTPTLTSSKLLKDFIEFEHEMPRELLHGIGFNILSTAGINKPDLIEIVAQVGDSIGKLSSNVYIDAAAHTVAKFLDSKGLLSIDTAYPFSQSYVNFVEDRADAKAINGTESLITAIAYGFIDFVASLGYNLEDFHEEMYKLFSEELKTAHFNAASPFIVSSAGSSTQQPIEGSAYIQLDKYQEKPLISAATNPDVSGVLALSSNDYASSAGSTTKPIEGSTYEQPATLQGYLHQPVIPAVPNPAIELFVKSLTQTLTSSKLLKDFIEFEHQKPRELLHGVGFNILSTAGINKPDLIEMVAQVGDSIDKLSSKVWLDAEAYTLAKFLDSKGLLSMDNVYPFCQSFVHFVENRVNTKAVVDPESFMTVIGNGFFDFVASLGYNFEDTHEELYKIFSEELKTAHFNAASPLNGYVSSAGSSTQQPIESSTDIQPATLQGKFQEQPPISAATSPDVSGALAISSNGYVSSAGSTTKPIEGSTYLQPAALQGYFHQPVIPATPNPAIELFVMSLTPTLTSSNLLKNFIEFEHLTPRELLHGVGFDILSTAGINNPTITEMVAQVGDSIGKLSSNVYIEAQTRTVAKFLDSLGLLSIDTVYPLSQSFVHFVENRANTNAVVDTKSLMSIIVYGFFDFIESLGYHSEDTYEKVYKLFSEELKAAHFNSVSL